MAISGHTPSWAVISDLGRSTPMPANEKMPESQFRRIINTLCHRWHIPAYADYMSERYWPAFSRLEDEGQRAFWDVLGVKEENGKETVHAVCDDRSSPGRY